MISAAAILPSAALILSPIAPWSKIRSAAVRAIKPKPATGVKYDANDIYIATFYSETRNMTPVSGGFANKTQNFEAVIQYQFDFGLRPSLGYVLSKGKDIEGVGSEDLVNYIDVGATYYFNKNMSAFVDYKINQLDSDNTLGINDDDIVAIGLTYQF